jgi:hypothetical protein
MCVYVCACVCVCVKCALALGNMFASNIHSKATSGRSATHVQQHFKAPRVAIRVHGPVSGCLALDVFLLEVGPVLQKHSHEVRTVVIPGIVPRVCMRAVRWVHL